jgi:hypothetical protein
MPSVNDRSRGAKVGSGLIVIRQEWQLTNVEDLVPRHEFMSKRRWNAIVVVGHSENQARISAK